MHLKTLCTILLVSGAATAAVPADPDRAARQNHLLKNLGASFVPYRIYRPAVDTEECSKIGTDANALVARLELRRRGLAGGLSPAAGAPYALHIAQKYLAHVGTAGAPGPCSWRNAGNPAVMYAAQSLGYALHRYGTAWPQEVKNGIRVALRDGYHKDYGYAYLTNGWANLVAGDLLAGEALADSTLFNRGLSRLRKMYATSMASGGIELQSPTYSSFHYPPLIHLQVLKHQEARSRARILLEYELLVNAHLYLPGGGIGAPQDRDYGGGTADARGVLRMWWLLTGEPASPPPTTTAMMDVAAATSYAVPEIIRSIFIDKGDGYMFWAFAGAPTNNPAWAPNAGYDFGLDGARVTPWHVVMMPGGKAATGVSYGWRETGLQVTSGTYIKNPAGGFEILYHYQPLVTGDTFDTGTLIRSAGIDSSAGDFTSELYDYERHLYGRTLLQLFDPTLKRKGPGVKRTWTETRASIPDFNAIGGRMIRAGAWYVGQLGTTLVAFRPLGTVLSEAPRGNGRAIAVRLAGESGSIVELSSTREFASLEAYAADLQARHFSFTRSPLAVEFDGRTRYNQKVRLRLDYRPERRFVRGVEAPPERLDQGLMRSPFVTWDAQSRVLEVRRECYAGLRIDTLNGKWTTAPAQSCLQAAIDAREAGGDLDAAVEEAVRDGDDDAAPDVVDVQVDPQTLAISASPSGCSAGAGGPSLLALGTLVLVCLRRGRRQTGPGRADSAQIAGRGS